MKKELSRLLSLIGICVVLSCPLSCGGDDPNPPANVAGQWIMAPINMEEATLTQCTGDMQGLNGRTLAELVALNPCIYSPFFATQNGTTFTFVPADFDCMDGNYGYVTADGSVSGDSVSCQINNVSQYNGDTVTAYHSGNMTGPATISLSNRRMDISGISQGECRISPAYRTVVTIVGADGGVFD